MKLKTFKVIVVDGSTGSEVLEEVIAHSIADAVNARANVVQPTSTVIDPVSKLTMKGKYKI